MSFFENNAAAYFLGLIVCALPLKLVAENLSAERWHPVEITLIADKTHADPFYDTDVTATFTGPGGETLVRPAFWDGGNIWKIRFAPTEVGTWAYTTTCNDPSDSGLQGQRGEHRLRFLHGRSRRPTPSRSGVSGTTAISTWMSSAVPSCDGTPTISPARPIATPRSEPPTAAKTGSITPCCRAVTGRRIMVPPTWIHQFLMPARCGGSGWVTCRKSD